MDVIPYRKFRKIQVRGDFLVGQAFGDKRHQLLLTQSKVRPCGGAWGGQLSGHFSDEAEERAGKLRGADGLSAKDGADGRDNVRRGSIFQQIAGYAGADSSDELRFLRIHANQEHLETELVHALERKVCRKPGGLKRGDDQHIALGIQDGGNGYVDRRTLPTTRRSERLRKSRTRTSRSRRFSTMRKPRLRAQGAQSQSVPISLAST